MKTQIEMTLKSNLSDDFSDDNLEETNKNEEKDLFELNFSKFSLNNNKKEFLKKKGFCIKMKLVLIRIIF